MFRKALFDFMMPSFEVVEMAVDGTWYLSWRGEKERRYIFAGKKSYEKIGDQKISRRKFKNALYVESSYKLKDEYTVQEMRWWDYGLWLMSRVCYIKQKI